MWLCQQADGARHIPLVLHCGRDVVLHDQRCLDAVADVGLPCLAPLTLVRLGCKLNGLEHHLIAEEAAGRHVNAVQHQPRLVREGEGKGGGEVRASR